MARCPSIGNWPWVWKDNPRLARTRPGRGTFSPDEPRFQQRVIGQRQVSRSIIARAKLARLLLHWISSFGNTLPAMLLSALQEKVLVRT